jgi:hypothetical protein
LLQFELSESQSQFRRPSFFLTASSNSFVLPVAFAGSIAVIRDIFCLRLFLVCRFSFGFLTDRRHLTANWSDSKSPRDELPDIVSESSFQR